MDTSKLLNFDHLNSKTQEHLSKVYGTLALTLASCSTGVIIAPPFAHNFLFLIAILVATFVLVMLVHSSQSQTTKLYSLLAIGFIDGMIMQPLINYAIHLDPAILVNAIVISTSLFIGLSLVSLLTKQRSLLFLGGIAASVMLWVGVASLLGWLFGFSLFTYMQYNCLMLAVYAMFTIYDTQLIIVKFENGDKNHFAHALELFIDFVRLFIHILRILIKLSEDKDKKKK